MNIETNKYVDVHDVPQGSRCGCVCMSCGLPLIARQGSINRWHFAHSDNANPDVTVPCEFSFFFGIKKMVIQIMSEYSQKPIQLPQYRKRFSHSHSDRVLPINYEVVVPVKEAVILENVSVNKKHENYGADIYSTVQGVPLLFFLRSPEHHSNIDWSRIKSEPKIGVLEIDLAPVRALFSQSTQRDGIYIQLLENYLFNDKSSKHWAFHSRETSLIQNRIKEMQNEPNQRRTKFANSADETDYFAITNSPSRGRERSSLPNISVGKIRCGRCKGVYEPPYYATPKCPYCKSTASQSRV